MRTVATLALIVLVVLPWLNPFSPGPTPAVIPLLFAWVCGALFVGVAICTSETRSDHALDKSLASAWLMAAAISALFGLMQFYGVAYVVGPWINRTEMGEAFGNLRQRNQYATLTNIGIAALAYWANQLSALPRGSAGYNWAARATPFVWPMWLVLACIVLLVAGNAASSSRTGLLQLLVLMAIGLMWAKTGAPAEGDRRSAWKLYGVALVAYGVLSVALPVLGSLNPNATGMLGRWHDTGQECAGRLTLWSNVLHLIAQKPWFGWGWGELDYAHFVTLYSGDRFCDILDNAHNLPLHLAVELGVPTAVFFCLLGVRLVWGARPWKESDPARQLAWTVLALIGVHSLLEYPLWYGPFQAATGLSIWILCSPSKGRGAAFSGYRFSRTTIRGATLFLVAAVTAFSCYVAWDYWRISQLYLGSPARAQDYKENTMEKVKNSVLFQEQVQFAEITTQQISPGNVSEFNAKALQLLHFSPEPRVVEQVIESAIMLGRNDDAAFYLERYRIAFPDAYKTWSAHLDRHKAP